MEDPEIQDVPVQDVPWYRGSTDARPFVLSKVLNVGPFMFLVLLRVM